MYSMYMNENLLLLKDSLKTERIICKYITSISKNVHIDK